MLIALLGGTMILLVKAGVNTLWASVTLYNSQQNSIFYKYHYMDLSKLNLTLHLLSSADFKTDR
ncbi:hypothetical protein QW71_28095 [Paenibacillus sp. IHB B 3415]|nr:hypothetical protein QW71_28095 [Paenibacillus sp. IHB B 3415]